MAVEVKKKIKNKTEIIIEKKNREDCPSAVLKSVFGIVRLFFFDVICIGVGGLLVGIQRSSVGSLRSCSWSRRLIRW